MKITRRTMTAGMTAALSFTNVAHATEYFTLEAVKRQLFPEATSFDDATFMLSKTQKKAISKQSRTRVRFEKVPLYRAVNDGKKWIEGPHVDASYDMPDGRSFEDVKGFKELALENPDKIARNLVRQVVTYATGAKVQFADRREIEAIIARISKDDYGFRSLIHEVTQSDIFKSK